MTPRELLAWGLVGVAAVTLVTCSQAAAWHAGAFAVERGALLARVDTALQREARSDRQREAEHAVAVRAVADANRQTARADSLAKRAAVFEKLTARHMAEANARVRADSTAVVSVDTARQWLADAAEEAQSWHRAFLAADSAHRAERAARQVDSLAFARTVVDLRATIAQRDQAVALLKRAEARCGWGPIGCLSRTQVAITVVVLDRVIPEVIKLLRERDRS